MIYDIEKFHIVATLITIATRDAVTREEQLKCESDVGHFP